MDRPLVWQICYLDSRIEEIAECFWSRRRSFLHLILRLHQTLRDDLNLLRSQKKRLSFYNNPRLHRNKEVGFVNGTEEKTRQVSKLHNNCDPVGQPDWQGTIEDKNFRASSYKDHPQEKWSCCCWELRKSLQQLFGSRWLGYWARSLRNWRNTVLECLRWNWSGIQSTLRWPLLQRKGYFLSWGLKKDL